MEEKQLRLIMLYEFKKNNSARQAAENINAAFGQSTTSHVTVSRWYKRFADGDISLKDRARSGRPCELDDDTLRNELQLYPDATTRELAERLNCSHTTIENHLHALGYRKVLARWIPHVLTEATRTARVSICQSLLLRSHRKDFLAHSVTGDESYILYENDTRHAFWIPRGDDPPVQSKPNTHRRKILLSCFWDAQGMLFWELLHDKQTVTAELYAEQLRRLATAIQEKRPRRVEVHLLHDNARPNVASVSRCQLEQLGWEVVPHPAYSPDLAPSDYHLFRALKYFIRKKKFRDFTDIKCNLDLFFNSQSQKFWSDGIQSLPLRWSQVIDAQGDYIVD